MPSPALALTSTGWPVGSNPAGNDPRPVRIVNGIGIGEPGPPDAGMLTEALGGADLVVVENLCTIPLNPSASHAVGPTCCGDGQRSSTTTTLRGSGTGSPT
ncbi:MAG: hypothetical protein CM1200mP26_00670 [Acidimicrobiales bacterium]|nr:MAG: hypothetical protein CM1200mP26_00670 [Acidimicrobiales bacterium]